MSGTATDKKKLNMFILDLMTFSSYIDGDLLEDDGSFSFEIAPPEWARDYGQFVFYAHLQWIMQAIYQK